MGGFIGIKGEVGHVKILAFSDIHCDANACEKLVAVAGDADLIIGAGDFAQWREDLRETMLLLEPFADKAIYVPGNNESYEELVGACSATVLHGQSVERLGVTIFGIGSAIPELNITAWESVDMSENDANHMFSKVSNVDILITHSPPKGVVDNFEGVGSMGSVAVRNAIKRLQPKFVLCGHVHDSWGETGFIGDSKVMNLGPTVNWIEI